MSLVCHPLLNSLSRWPRSRLVVATLLCGLIAQPTLFAADESAPDKAITLRAADADTFTVTPAGSIELSLTRAPATSHDITVKVVNSAGFALWQAPLTRTGTKYTAKLNRDAVEAILVANAVFAEFPGSATGGKDLRISFIRDRFADQLTATASLVGSQPLFYESPKAPEPLADLPASPDVTKVNSYAMAVRRYDEQLTTYYHQLIAAHAGAHSLWNDLHTSGRLPSWPANVISAQEKGYAELAAKKDAVLQQRTAVRQSALATIKQWNSANPNETPIELSFREST